MARKKVTVSLAEEWETKLREYADSRGLSVSTIVQLAVEEYLRIRSGEGDGAKK